MFILGWGHRTEFKDRGGTPHKGVGTPHITSHTTQNQGGTPHKKMCSDVYTGVGTPHITPYTTQNQGGTPHMNLCSDVHTGVGTPHRITEEKTSMVGVGVGWSGEII